VMALAYESSSIAMRFTRSCALYLGSVYVILSLWMADVGTVSSGRPAEIV
jgi:hypothetical protein